MFCTDKTVFSILWATLYIQFKYICLNPKLYILKGCVNCLKIVPLRKWWQLMFADWVKVCFKVCPSADVYLWILAEIPGFSCTYQLILILSLQTLVCPWPLTERRTPSAVYFLIWSTRKIKKGQIFACGPLICF